MRKIRTLVCVLLYILGLAGCDYNSTDSITQNEAVSTDYGKVIEQAKDEFSEIFKEFENIKIEETSTMARTDDAKEIVVQITYSSANGSGVYGFLYSLDDYDNPELMQQGENITIDNILE